jgi:hypothetical protein
MTRPFSAVLPASDGTVSFFDGSADESTAEHFGRERDDLRNFFAQLQAPG